MAKETSKAPRLEISHIEIKIIFKLTEKKKEMLLQPAALIVSSFGLFTSF